MPQFDFFIISKATTLFASLAVFLFFTILFSVQIGTWLTTAVRLLYKVELINKASDFRLEINSIAGMLVSVTASDLLEQFFFNWNYFISVLGFILALLIPFALLFIIALPILKALVDFATSVLKDIAQDDFVYFSRNILGFSTVFVAVLVANLVGVLPFSFTLTSTVAAPFLFSLIIFFSYFYILITKYGLTLFAGFLPTGTSIFIAPLIVAIEAISTVAKFISLGIRLFANMFAGHLLLKVFYSIAFQIALGLSLFFAVTEVFVLFFLLFITALESMIAFLQAFVMLLLGVLYFKEAENFILNH